VFFVVTHLVLGARIVALAHNVSPRTAEPLAYAGVAGLQLLRLQSSHRFRMSNAQEFSQ
jgi:hypothetical protein